MQSLRSFFNKTSDDGTVHCRLYKKHDKAAKDELAITYYLLIIITTLFWKWGRIGIDKALFLYRLDQ